MPIETEARAYLRITGSGLIEEITGQLGLEPDDGWSEGDPKRRGSGIYGFSSWVLHSGERTGSPLDTQFRSLWKRIEPHKDRLRALGPEFSRFLVCTAWFPTRDTQLNIAAGHFATAAYYRLEPDFDFYFDDDFGHEDAGKGYATW